MPQPTEEEHTPPAKPKASAMIILIALAFAGGYADAATYLLAGSFTGHITGNTVLGAISLARGDFHRLGLQASAVAAFLVATYVGELLSTRKDRGHGLVGTAFAVEGLLIALAPVGTYFHWPSPALFITLCLCLALGLQNGVFHKSAGVSLHTTYITGNVTTLLSSLIGNSAPASTASAVARPKTKNLLITWATFTAGAIVSGIAVHYCGTFALWLLELPLLGAGIANLTSQCEELQ